MHTIYTNNPNNNLRSMAVLSGARLSREAAKTRANERRSREKNKNPTNHAVIEFKETAVKYIHIS